MRKILLKEYPRKNINYEHLDSLLIPYNEPFILVLNWEGITFEFLIKLKQHSEHLIVLGSGAMNFNENRIPPPYFQRHSWIQDFEDSTIYYNDPTLYADSELLVGWGQGINKRFFIKDIATILEKLIKKVSIPFEKVIFYGSSAGGFMSLILSGYLKDSIALVNSPQTNLLKWLPVPVKQVFKYSYPNMSETDIVNNYFDRIDVVHFYKHIKYVPKIYYLQNAYCEIDIKDHVIPFIIGIQGMGAGCKVNKVILDFYYDVRPGPSVRPALGGHGALGKADTLKYIDKVKKEF